MKKLNITMFALLIVALNALAGIPEGYYSNADGNKFKALKAALTNIIKSHETFGYSSLWDYYPYTYYVLDNKEQVLDLYSNNVVYFSNHSSMNKEHAVPKSWWGGSTSSGPGCDIFNVMPSNSKANSAKSNYPLGEISGKASYDNGVTRIGESAIPGFSGSVFEPIDEYKGDFARIYFYVATCYPDLSWDSNNAKAFTNSTELTLKSWIIPMLIEWHNSDPVDAGEIQRNEDIFKVQKNRNPFIDYPSLVEYIWGEKTNEAYIFSEHKANEGEGDDDMKAKVPTFNIDYGTEMNPKTVADGTEVTVEAGTSTSTLFVSVNGGDWEQIEHTTGYNSTSQTEYNISAKKKVTISGDVRIEAYCTMEGYKNSTTVTAYYKGVSYSDDYLLHEAFDTVTGGNNTSATGSSTAWGGNENFVEVSTVFIAGNAVRLGSSKKTGSLTSRELMTTGGTLIVTLDVKGWSSVEGDLAVSLTGAGEQTIEYTATFNDEFEHKELVFNNVSANPVLTISTTSKRAFVDNIIVSEQTNGIENPAINVINDNKAYNLAGQVVDESSYKGIVIKNGKKILK